MRFLLLFSLFSFSLFADKPLALLIDGQNKFHKWQETSPQIISILDGKFKVERITKTQKEWQDNDIEFSKYKIIILNYWGEWPKTLFDKLDNYMKSGGGLVTVHSALAGFGKNPAFAKMVGLKWQGKNGGKRIYLDNAGKLMADEAGKGEKVGHSKQHAFPLQSTSKSLFTKLIQSSSLHNRDEMYHALRGPAENMEIQPTALSPVTKKNEPIIWTVKYEAGRSFVTALGHSKHSMESKLFKESLLKGALWAAEIE